MGGRRGKNRKGAGEFSTVDSIMVISCLLGRELAKKKGKMFAKFINFEKAFDTVERSKL